MSARKTVPVAYVTKWATTQGIAVWKDAELSEGGYLYRRGKWTVSASAKHWTTDKAEAEKRYRAMLDRAYTSAMKKAKALKAAINAPPKYTEDES